ncbi:MAG: membrane protein insertion efficiency factor YidD [Planctomycetales bacterium]|nr:membrane protein insertion efficiency factor YidD [Planctomycetales bacterium]
MRQLLRLPGRCVILVVRIYQRGVSPLLGQNCRFQPTCSEYMIGAIKKNGLLRGVVQGGLRIVRCHPFSRGGYDPP